jgi:superfamily II DNA or RNA helicase
MSHLQPPEWVESRPYQATAIRNWFDADAHGILRMATGTGKTVTALQAAARIADAADDGFLLIVAVPYQHLVDQWAADLHDFGADPIYAYQSRRKWQPRLERELLELNRGGRAVSTVVTTHKTLANPPTRQTLRRSAVPMMVIGDEVHHLGAPHMQKGLISEFRFRLGLSATPERWYDDEGTAVLEDYFDDTVFEYGLREAIEAGVLCEYYYVPHIVQLTDEELKIYDDLSAQIGQLMPDTDDGEMDLEAHPQLQQILFKRARLVGTAERKLDLLTELIGRQTDAEHTLVYCSDGSSGAEPGVGQRHVDATTDRLRSECGLQVSRFTARESQDEREGLLEAFEQGEIQVLTSIRCLDEGVDVPATRTAYMLASTSNPRQYVQRRGRILRTHPGKDLAVIHDFITVPDTDTHPEYLTDDRYSSERSLVEKELQRASTFAEAARNHPDADIDGVPTSEGSLAELKEKYNLITL